MNLRELLLNLGVSNLNATIMIQYLFMNPATTDPKAPPVQMLIEHLQQGLNQIGANVPITGRIDDATNAAMESLLPGWLFQPWSQAVHAVVSFRDSGGMFKAGPVSFVARPMGALPLGLPDVPGGALTYIAGAALAWHFWKKRRK